MQITRRTKIIYKILPLLLLLALIISSSLSYSEDRVLPDELLKIIMATPETLHATDLEALKKWHSSIQKARHGTVAFQRPEFDNNSQSFLGSFQVRGKYADTYMKECSYIRANYVWLPRILDMIALLADRDTIFSTPNANDPSSIILIDDHLQNLSYLTQLMSKIHLEMVSDREEVEVDFLWRIPKTSLVRTIHSLGAIEVLDTYIDKLDYPSENWDPSSGIPITEHRLLASTLAYRNGHLHIIIRDNFRRFCLDQYYFGIQARVKTSYEISRHPDERATLTTHEAPVKLYGHSIIENAEFLDRGREKLSTLRWLTQEFTHWQISSPSRALLLFRLLNQEYASCQQSQSRLTSANSLPCQYLKLFFRKHPSYDEENPSRNHSQEQTLLTKIYAQVIK